MAKLENEPDSAAFEIGAGCTHAFNRDGRLVAFANDSSDGYGNNRGRMTLTAVPGGVAPAPNAYVGWIGAWRRFVDTVNRTAGIPVIAALVLGLSWILIFMTQGQDLVRGVGEELPGFAGWVQRILFVIGLLFFAVQTWSWSRLVVTSNYGFDRSAWSPRWLLEWGPRALGFIPFLATAVALWTNSGGNVAFAAVLVALGLVVAVLLVKRRDIYASLVRRGAGERIRYLQRNWALLGLLGALAAMAVATLLPVHFGVGLGAPAVVFFGLGFIIPVIVAAIQMGAGLRIPVVGALLLWAVLLGAFFDNHAVGRRAFGGAITFPKLDSSTRPTLAQAYGAWADAQPGGREANKTIILIASQGGASRAGYWTAVALARLQEAAAQKKAADGKPVDFGAHVFAISSVSGGSVGSVGYAAMLKTARDDPDFTTHLLRFAGRDALGPALTGMLYSDLLYRFLPLPFLPDRAETIERAWEAAWQASGGPAANEPVMREPFLALAPKEGEPWRPLLIVQGSSESRGRRVLTGAVALDCTDVDADDFLASEGHDVGASTAILNGARFPWISPAGTFMNSRCAAAGKRASAVEDHVLDGGYFDNAGAETLREMVRAIRELPNSGPDTLNIVFILIGYADHDPATPPPPPKTGFSAWLSNHVAALATNDVFAPLFGLYDGMDAHEGHLAREMKAALAGQTPVVNPDPYVSQKDIGYAAIVLCPIGPDPGVRRSSTIRRWTGRCRSGPSGYIRNLAQSGTRACAAEANADAIGDVIDKLAK